MDNPSFKDYFSFSRKERSSIITLLILIFLVGFSFEIYEQLGFNRTEIVIPSIPKKEQVETDTIKNQNSVTRKKSNKNFQIEPIDINLASPKDFEVLHGIGPVLSQRIVKYRRKIKGFDDKEDLLNVYGLNLETFNNIEPYVTLTAQSSSSLPQKYIVKNENHYKEIETSNQLKVDINVADSATFSLLKGIGPKLSGRIVKYREIIGGFDSIGHLKKVYGINEDLYKTLEPLLISTKRNSITLTEMDSLQSNVELTLLDLDINTVNAKDLERIKGIGPFYSNAIIELRSNLGGIAKMEQLRSIYKMDDITYEHLIKNVKIKTPHNTFDINTIEFKNLLRMKILDYEQVKYVFNLKKSLGLITSADQLRKLQGIPSEKLDLLLLYLNFEETNSLRE